MQFIYRMDVVQNGQKLPQKINIRSDGNRRTPAPPSMDFFHNFLFAGLPQIKGATEAIFNFQNMRFAHFFWKMVKEDIATPKYCSCEPGHFTPKTFWDILTS